jgi:hypothetical protein
MTFDSKGSLAEIFIYYWLTKFAYQHRGLNPNLVTYESKTCQQNQGYRDFVKLTDSKHACMASKRPTFISNGPISDSLYLTRRISKFICVHFRF